MPDENGKLSLEDKEAAVRWINEKVKNHACICCGSNDWSIGDHIVELRPFVGGGITVGGVVYPALVLTCNVCAYARFHMALPTGLLNVPTSPSGEKAGE